MRYCETSIYLNNFYVKPWKKNKSNHIIVCNVKWNKLRKGKEDKCETESHKDKKNHKPFALKSNTKTYFFAVWLHNSYSLFYLLCGNGIYTKASVISYKLEKTRNYSTRHQWQFSTLNKGRGQFCLLIWFLFLHLITSIRLWFLSIKSACLNFF